MFGRLKDWRRVATRYGRCTKVFLSAVALAATVMFQPWVLSLMRNFSMLADAKAAEDEYLLSVAHNEIAACAFYRETATVRTR